MERLLRTIPAETDDGRVVLIREFQEYASAASFDAPRAVRPTLRRYNLQDGGPVNLKADGSFEDVLSGRILRPLA